MFKAVIFDFDGTLIDSVLDMYDGVRHVFKKAGLDAPSFEEFYKTYSEPYLEYYRKYGITFSKEEILHWYLEVANKKDLPFFPDVIRVIENLSVRGVLMGIISGNDHSKILRTCEQIGLQHYLKAVIGQARDKVERIRSFCSENNVLLTETYYVGDFISDVRDAKKAGVVAIGITRGHKSFEALMEHGADYCITDLSELLYM